MAKDLMIPSQEVGIMIPPEETIEAASKAAKALKRVVSLKTKPVIMDGEQYLEFEDLQLLGQFYGYTVKTGNAVPVDIDGVKGAKASADLIDFKTGVYLGGAEAYCMRDEEYWNMRPKYEWQGEGDSRQRVKIGDVIVPWFQLASMAQTRAGAKAFRNRLAWVVVLAGYRPTPAEEMTEDTASSAVKERRTVDKTEHWCSEHATNFFKRGKMKGYAHKIEGTDEWCNEETAEKPVREPPPETLGDKSSVAKVETNAVPPKEVEQPAISPLDLDWLREQLGILQGRKLKAWTNANVLSYLTTLTGREANSITEAVSYLSKEQADDFVKRVQEIIELG